MMKSLFYAFVLDLVPMGEHISNCFLGLGLELCCSSIYGAQKRKKKKDSTKMTKCPFMFLLIMHFLLLFFLFI